MEVEMKIRGLMMDPVTNMPIVVLKDPAGDAVLPIWVGIYEANAIALEIEKVATPRPMTHDLIKNLLTGLDTQSAQSSRHRAARRHVLRRHLAGARGAATSASIPVRPTRLAVAMRLDCPIFVEDEVLKIFQAGRHRLRPRLQRRAAQVAGEPGRRRLRPLQDVVSLWQLAAGF